METVCDLSLGRCACFMLLALGILNAEAKGVFEFTLRELEVTESKVKEFCCKHSSERMFNCLCEFGIRICVGLGPPTLKYHNCPLIYHHETVIFNGRLEDAKVLDVPFEFRWPQKDVSIVVDVVDKRTAENLIVSTQFPMKSLSSFDEPVHFVDITNNGTITYDLKIICGEHYYGKDCKTYCNTQGPFRNMKCLPRGEHACNEGWSGRYCNDAICELGCLHGTCETPNACKCRSGWKGEQCDQCKVLDGCVNGFCTKPNECICSKNWGGHYCENDLDYCYHHSPCQNGGTCLTNGRQNYYQCKCTEAYEGRDCEIFIDRCRGLNCGSNGKCIVNGTQPKCSCKPGFFGSACQYRYRMPNESDLSPASFSLHRQNGTCKIDETEYVVDGWVWRTENCRYCSCSNGEIVCSSPECELHDCYDMGNNREKKVLCPGNQICNFVSHSDCLKGECKFLQSKCVLPIQLKKERSFHRLCGQSRSGNICLKLLAKINMEALPENTSIEDFCHRLLLETIRGEIFDVGYICGRISPDQIMIDVIPLNANASADAAKSHLIEHLRRRITSDQVLLTVSRIDEEHASKWPSGHVKASTPQLGERSPSSTKWMLLLIILLLLIIITLMMVFIYKFLPTLFNYAYRVCIANQTPHLKSCPIPETVCCVTHVYDSVSSVKVCGMDHSESGENDCSQIPMRSFNLRQTSKGHKENNQNYLIHNLLFESRKPEALWCCQELIDVDKGMLRMNGILGNDSRNLEVGESTKNY